MLIRFLFLFSDYNIYKDPAPSENSKALKVLEDLMSKVEQFLSEWPEHPTLTQVRLNAWLYHAF